MELQKISDKVWVFIFEENIIITALVNDQKAILIDAGFEEQGKKVKEHLEDEKVKVQTIIFTHYHPDHVGGSTAFDDVQLLCNRKYEHNYDFFQKNYGDKVKLVKPTKVFGDNETLTLDGFELKFLDAPGHSECGSIIVIDGEIINVGDLMMQSLDNRPALPCVNYDSSVSGHIRSLELMLELNPKALIMGHGKPLLESSTIYDEVNKRLYYLKNIVAKNGLCELQECLPDNINNWDLHHAHESNLQMFNERG